ncbi:MAG: TolB protein [Myxococcota bacterium]
MIALLIALACTPAPKPPAEPPPPATAPAPAEPPPVTVPAGRLLHVTEGGPVPTVAVVSTDGAGAQVLGAFTGSAFPGEPDPTGEAALVVTSEDEGDTHREQLWLVPFAGGEPTALTPPAGMVRNPSWAPGGRWLVFESDARSYRDLYRADRAGGAPRRLTDEKHGSFEPAVSPDGRKIAFGSSRDGNAEVYVMVADGTGARRLTNHPADDVRPRWSPSGDRIAWLSSRDGMPRVWISAADGSGAHALRPPAKAVDLDLAWSSRGELAVVEQVGPTEVRIVVLAGDGSQRAVLDGPGVDEHPSWSPDGTWLAFTSSRAGDPDVWVGAADGSAVHRVTTSDSPEWLPRWVR